MPFSLLKCIRSETGNFQHYHEPIFHIIGFNWNLWKTAVTSVNIFDIFWWLLIIKLSFYQIRISFDLQIITAHCYTSVIVHVKPWNNNLSNGIKLSLLRLKQEAWELIKYFWIEMQFFAGMHVIHFVMYDYYLSRVYYVSMQCTSIQYNYLTTLLLKVLFCSDFR